MLIGISFGEIGTKAEELGIDEYLANLRENSMIFEDYYIAPDSVEICFPDKKRNMIFIYLESMEATYASVEEGGGKPIGYIPELVFLADNYVNISSTNNTGVGYCGALTDWTIAAILGSTSGVPYKIPGGRNDANMYADFLPGLVTLGDLLNQEGYHNYFLCGSNAEFAGRDVYFKKHGNYEIMDYFYAVSNAFIPTDYSVSWGYEDKKLFAIARQELDRITAVDEPFNFTMLTVDTHQPNGYVCDLCENQYEQQYANVIACSSRQVFEFVQWVQSQRWYENTTIILVGDHTSMVADFWDDIGDYQRKTYNCFLNLPENTDLSHIKNREFTTLDIFPTTLAALGARIEGERLGLGTNLFSQEETLSEKLGFEYFNQELKKYSKYYDQSFVKH